MHVLNAMLWRGRAGTERAYLSYTDLLIEGGFECTALVDSGYPFLDALRRKNVPIEKGWYDQSRARWWRFAGKRRYQQAVARLLRRGQIEFLLSHTFPHMQAAQEACGDAALHIAVLHLHVSRMMPLQALRGWLPRCDHFIVLNSTEKARLNEAGIDNVSVIPNAVQVPGAQRARARRNGLVVGCLGTLEKRKGQDLLIAALRGLCANGTIAKLVLGGTGPAEAALRDLVAQAGLAQCVEFVGWVHDVSKFYQSIDVLAVPSRQEAFGLVVLEAMAHSVPVVASATDGPRDIITDADNGILFETGNPHALGRAIERVARDAELYQRLSRQGYARALRYSRQRVAGELSRVLRQCRELRLPRKR